LNQYLDALRARNKCAPSEAFGSRQKAKGTAIDLDNGVLDESASLEHRRMDELAVLKTKLQSCPSCGPDFFCKIGKDNKHKHLTHHQIQGWALALVCIHACVSIVYSYNL
jgi:hypothetical protein